VSELLERNEKKLKIGLIVDSTSASKYICDLASWAQRQSELEITALILQNIPNSSSSLIVKSISSLRKRGVLHLLNQVGYTLLMKLESLVLRFNIHHKDHLIRQDLLQYVSNIIKVEPVVSKSGFVYRYRKEDISKINQEKFDILIRCGSGILRGDILNASRLGVLSFHHADNRINRGGPPGFWEVFNRDDATGFIIQRLTDELDGGNVIYRGFFATKFYYLLNQANLYHKSNFYLKKILIDLAATNQLPRSLIPLPYYNKLYKLPNLLTQAMYLLKTSNLLISKLFIRYIFKKKYRWGVAFQFSAWQDMVMWKSLRIKNPSNHFLADPFVVSFEGKHFCFVEDYNYQKSRAGIALYELNEHGYASHGLVLEEQFHMSYPYVFEYKSKFYMIPETSENRDIRLYEAQNFPRNWTFKKTIFSDVSAADTTVFEKNGMWWLFTNIDPSNTGDHSSELYIFYSNCPLSDEWTSHPNNPVICDSKNARNGGIIIESDSVYRISQKQGFDMYGKSFNINKITELTTLNYNEELIVNIEANFFPDIKGTHHFHSNNTVSVFDFVGMEKF
jgi:hypothetical protein